MVQSKKGQNSKYRKVPFQKRVKNRQKKWNHFRKGSKFLNKNRTISEKGLKSSKNWYHYRKGLKILNKIGTISENGEHSSTKIVPFQAEKGQNSSTKMVSFQKRIKNPQQKWNHFRKGSKILDKNGTISVRKGSYILDKKGTISEKGQNTSTKMIPFQKRVKNRQQKWYHYRKGSKILNKNGTISEKCHNSSTKRYHFNKKGTIGVITARY